MYLLEEKSKASSNKGIKFYGFNTKATVCLFTGACNTDNGIDTLSTNLQQQKGYLNHCNCNCKELSADIEGIKLDMVISETRLDRNINQNTREIEKIKAVVNTVQSKAKTRPQAPTSLETLNYATNTIKIPDGDIEVHNYTIPTNGNHAENSHANFKMNEETREALTIKEKTKRTEPSFEDQRNEYIRSHKQTQKGKIKSKSRNTKLSFGEQQREYICKHKREFIEKNSIERNKETNRQNSGMQNFLEVRKFRRMKQSQTKRNLRKKVIEDQEKSWREYLNLVRQVTTNTTSTTSQYVGKRQLETVTSPLIPSNTRDIHPHVHSQRLIKNQFPFQPTMYPPPLMLVPTKPPIWRQ